MEKNQQMEREGGGEKRERQRGKESKTRDS
jgi:hypothetical protein